MMTREEFLEQGGWIKSDREMELEKEGYGFFSHTHREYDSDGYYLTLKAANISARLWPLQYLLTFTYLLAQCISDAKLLGDHLDPWVRISGESYQRSGEAISGEDIYIRGRKNIIPSRYVWRPGNSCRDRALTKEELAALDFAGE